MSSNERMRVLNVRVEALSRRLDDVERGIEEAFKTMTKAIHRLDGVLSGHLAWHASKSEGGEGEPKRIIVPDN